MRQLYTPESYSLCPQNVHLQHAGACSLQPPPLQIVCSQMVYFIFCNHPMMLQAKTGIPVFAPLYKRVRISIQQFSGAYSKQGTYIEQAINR